MRGNKAYKIKTYFKASRNCKTQNSGLRSKEEKPRDPINQPSRCNTPRGFIVGCANGWLWSPGRQSTPNSKLGELFICKKNILSACYIRVKKWLVTRLQSNPIGTNFTGFCLNLKQFYWYKRRGLLFTLRRPRAFQLSLSGFLLGAYRLAGSRSPDGGGNPTISQETETQVPACLPAPAPAAPRNKTYFSASKTNKKNIRHMNYRHG